MTVSVFNEPHIRKNISLNNAALEAVEPAFTALYEGRATMPPVLRLDVPDHNGEMDVKTAYIKGFDSFCLKVSTGFFDNANKGLPSLGGMMTLLNAQTGHVQAVFLDNGYLTDIRTACAGAIAAKHLARKEARTVCIIGAGLQARLQLEALRLVRNITHVRVWNRHHGKAEEYAKETAQQGLEVTAFKNPQEAVDGADIIITTTPAKGPVLKAGWLSAGQHITAMGSDAEHKNEIDPHVFTKADLYVPDSQNQTARLGELHHALKAHVVSADFKGTELGKITAGDHPGRTETNQITFADLTGTGVQDTAIASFAYTQLS